MEVAVLDIFKTLRNENKNHLIKRLSELHYKLNNKFVSSELRRDFKKQSKKRLIKAIIFFKHQLALKEKANA